MLKKIGAFFVYQFIRCFIMWHEITFFQEVFVYSLPLKLKGYYMFLGIIIYSLFNLECLLWKYHIKVVFFLSYLLSKNHSLKFTID